MQANIAQRSRGLSRKAIQELCSICFKVKVASTKALICRVCAKKTCTRCGKNKEVRRIIRDVVYLYVMTFWRTRSKGIKVPLRRNFTFLFPPFFFAQNNLPSCTMSFRPEKKKLKRFPSLKFCRSKSEICRPPLLEIGSS